MRDVLTSGDILCLNVNTSNKTNGVDLSYLISSSGHSYFAFVKTNEWLERIREKDMCSSSEVF